LNVSKDLIFNRSARGNYRKFEEALKILEYSIIMVEFFGLKEFNNVVAIQLRIILCDTFFDRKQKTVIDNSLIRKINSEPKLFPISENYIELDEKGSLFIPGELFDYSKPMIELETWLEQVIYKISLGQKLHELSIKDFIKLFANKGGGAHVDSSLPEKAFIVDIHAERVLCDIARGLFRAIGRNYKENIYKDLKYLINKINENS
jgi:hypothetical protein